MDVIITAINWVIANDVVDVISKSLNIIFISIEKVVIKKLINKATNKINSRININVENISSSLLEVYFSYTSRPSSVGISRPTTFLILSLYLIRGLSL